MRFKILIRCVVLSLLVLIGVAQAFSIEPGHSAPKHVLCHSLQQLNHSQCYRSSSWWHLP